MDLANHSSLFPKKSNQVIANKYERNLFVKFGKETRNNKKVLQRETARGVTSPSITCPVGTPSCPVPGGVVPHPVLSWTEGGYPHPALDSRGTQSCHGWGTPRRGLGPVEVLRDGAGGTPWEGHVTSGSIMGWRWVPPAPRREQTENITFPHPSDEGGKKV